jgi:hypothetical protein
VLRREVGQSTPQSCWRALARDPFHVLRLAGDALDRCRRRIQQDLHGHRGRKDDPLYRARRTLHTGADLLTDRQRHRLTALFGAEDHVQVEAPGLLRPPRHQQRSDRGDQRPAGAPARLRPALGFRNLTNDIAGSPLETGGFRSRLCGGGAL